MPNKNITIHLIATARPNFMKIAPLYHELVKRDWATPIIVQTGQHYGINLSNSFMGKKGQNGDPHLAPHLC